MKISENWKRFIFNRSWWSFSNKNVLLQISICFVWNLALEKKLKGVITCFSQHKYLRTTRIDTVEKSSKNGNWWVRKISYSSRFRKQKVDTTSCLIDDPTEPETMVVNNFFKISEHVVPYWHEKKERWYI